MSTTNSPAVQPVSASPAKPLSDLEKEQRFRELRSRMNESRLKVIAPPGKVGYWARKDDEQELSRLNYMGFEIVHEADPKKPIWKASGLREDGTYCLGDVILVEIDAETYEFYLQEDQRKSEALVGSVKQSFVDDAERQGVPTFKVDKKSTKGG